MARQIEHLLAADTWPGGSELVFGTVKVSNYVTEDFYRQLVNGPFAIVSVGSDTPDDEKPNWIRQIFRVTYGTSNAGDRYGRAAIVGSGRLSAKTSSKGRGILEIRGRISAVLRRIQDDNGVKISARGRGSIEIDPVNGGYLAAQTQEIEALCTETEYYHPPLRVTVADATGGNALITWVDPPDRWDRANGARIQVRSAAGATPPATQADGTLVANVAIGTQTLTHAAGVGQISYTLFAGYDETENGEVGVTVNLEAFSDGTALEQGISGTATVS
ncbi:hypothetical protein [uncultured Mediterranean phage]|nr:hypothetical protein [uncultured Mediterranean phage]